MKCSTKSNGELNIHEWYADKDYGLLVEMIHNKIKYYQENFEGYSDKWVRRELSEDIADEVMKLMNNGNE